MKRLLPLLIILLILTSCTSFGDLVRSQVDGLPSWVNNPQVRADQYPFVGKGSAQVTYNARLDAYEHILEQISAFVGEDIREEYYRELTTTTRIADFNLSVTAEHLRTEKGLQQVYLLARADREALEGRRTTIYRQAIERQARIEALIVEADRSYRQNHDTLTIARYLEAATIASQGPVLEKKHDPAALIDRAVGYIKALQISFRSPDSQKVTATVQLRRRRRLISSRVLHAKVQASFTAYTSLGDPFVDTLDFNTATQGSFLFLPYNQLLLADGAITFSLDFTEELAKARPYVDEGLLASVEEALHSVHGTLPYSRVSPLGNRVVLTEIQEYSIEGASLAGTTAVQAFVDTMQQSRVGTQIIDLGSTDWEDQVEEIERRYGTRQYVYNGSVGIVAEDQALDVHVTVVVGRIQLHNMESGQMLFDSQDVEAVGSGATREESHTQALERFGTIAASLALASLFTP
ncbi:MAG: hypothetical protein WC233_01460 [Sphaerochaeta sp.]|jgi:hypothetical protein